MMLLTASQLHRPNRLSLALVPLANGMDLFSLMAPCRIADSSLLGISPFLFGM